jgi:hypothetical protein
MTKQTNLGGTFTLPNTSPSLYRMGYRAMQLAGPGVWGLPRDLDAAVAILRESIAVGVNHIDTSDFYGVLLLTSLLIYFRSSFAYRTGTARLEPPKPLNTAVFMPITLPLRLKSGPPEPPEVVAAS